MSSTERPTSTVANTAAIATRESGTLKSISYCDTVLCSTSAMAGALEMSHPGTGRDTDEGVAGSRPRLRPELASRVSSAVPSHPLIRLLISGWLTLMFSCDSVVCQRKASGGVSGLPWWLCEAGSALSPG